MKKQIIVVFILISSVLFSAEELDWVDTQIEAIKPPREGMLNSKLTKVSSPYIFLKKNKVVVAKKAASKAPVSKVAVSSSNSRSRIITKPTSKNLILDAVINKSALINGEWYKLGNVAYGYKISSVNSKNVVLTKGEKKIILTTSDTKQNIKFK